MKKGRTIQIRAGMVRCPEQRQDRPKAGCFGCQRFLGYTPLVVMCGNLPKVKVRA